MIRQAKQGRTILVAVMLDTPKKGPGMFPGLLYEWRRFTTSAGLYFRRGLPDPPPGVFGPKASK